MKHAALAHVRAPHGPCWCARGSQYFKHPQNTRTTLHPEPHALLQGGLAILDANEQEQVTAKKSACCLLITPRPPPEALSPMRPPLLSITTTPQLHRSDNRAGAFPQAGPVKGGNSTASDRATNRSVRGKRGLSCSLLKPFQRQHQEKINERT